MGCMEGFLTCQNADSSFFQLCFIEPVSLSPGNKEKGGNGPDLDFHNSCAGWKLSLKKTKLMALSPKGLWRGLRRFNQPASSSLLVTYRQNSPGDSAQRKHLSIHIESLSVQESLTPSASTRTFLSCLQSACECRKDHTQGWYQIGTRFGVQICWS